MRAHTLRQTRILIWDAIQLLADCKEEEAWDLLDGELPATGSAEALAFERGGPERRQAYLDEREDRIYAAVTKRNYTAEDRARDLAVCRRILAVAEVYGEEAAG
jgi:hypothetical protein